ncbi:hypothetical protein SLA2020_258340 [Shorea laevis]
MESDLLPAAPPLHPKTLPETQKSPSMIPFLLLLCGIFISRIPTSYALALGASSEYAKHCNQEIPDLPLNFTTLRSSPIANSLAFQIGFFSGGDSIFSQSNSRTEFPKSAIFGPLSASRAITNNNDHQPSVFKIQGRLSLQIPISFSVYRNGGHLTERRGLRFRVRGPRIPVFERGVQSFWLNGFWSESTGRLCMVGSGTSHGDAGKFKSFSVVLKLTYSKNSSIFGSFVSGVLESLDEKNGFSYFEPVSILGVHYHNDEYKYTLVDGGNGHSGLSEDDGGESLSLSDVKGGVCSVISERTLRFELEYRSECANASCSPLHRDVGYVPSFMFFRHTRCVDNGKMQILLAFRNSSALGRTMFPFDPNTTLIAEGAWDEKENRLYGVACQILNFPHSSSDAFVGDCSTKFSLRFPKILSLRKRGSLVGQIWSNKTENDPSNFGKIGFSSVRRLSLGTPGLKYEYTVIDGAIKSCANKNTAKLKRKTYPEGHSFDMRFNILLRNSQRQKAYGFASPLFVGDQLYTNQHDGLWQIQRPAFHWSNNSGSPLNISYEITFVSDFDFGGRIPISREVEISAEGIYDRDTGLLCMIGCRHLGSTGQKLMNNHSLDCNITVTLQFSPLNTAGTDHVKGVIESTRSKSDALYFERIDLSSRSIYNKQARESIWRMDLEIIMVLISNTLACVFVGLQLFHVKKHPDVLPFISVVMLIVLTLGHMIPLLLNFEALFVKNHNQQSAFLQSGGWLEVNEIIVRMVTMVAFLLQFRLLQLTWSARQSGDREKGLWGADKRVLYVSLPLYICGGLISWFVHQWKNSKQSPFLQTNTKFYVAPPKEIYQKSSLWTALKSYGGLVLDGFLLPQIAFNLFSNSSKEALSASFYIGTTLVRSLPHAYDLYRTHSSSGYLDFSYIYANHKMDFYSTAWDIIIPFGSLLFAFLVFLQQKFGGRCFLSRRYREGNVYEMVATVSSEELQGESVQKNFYSL